MYGLLFVIGVLIVFIFFYLVGDYTLKQIRFEEMEQYESKLPFYGELAAHIRDICENPKKATLHIRMTPSQRYFAELSVRVLPLLSSYDEDQMEILTEYKFDSRLNEFDPDTVLDVYQFSIIQSIPGPFKTKIAKICELYKVLALALILAGERAHVNEIIELVDQTKFMKSKKLNASDIRKSHLSNKEH